MKIIYNEIQILYFIWRSVSILSCICSGPWVASAASNQMIASFALLATVLDKPAETSVGSIIQVLLSYRNGGISFFEICIWADIDIACLHTFLIIP